MAISCQSETPCGLLKKPAQAVGAGRLNWWRPAVSVVARSKRRQDYSMGKAELMYLEPFDPGMKGRWLFDKTTSSTSI